MIGILHPCLGDNDGKMTDRRYKPQWIPLFGDQDLKESFEAMVVAVIKM